MRRSALITTFVICLILIAGCSAASPLRSFTTSSNGTAHAPSEAGIPPIPAPMPTSAPALQAPAMPAQGGAADSGQKSGIGDNIPSEVAPVTQDRMVVYNGTLRLEVSDAEQVVSKISDILKANNGYISNRSLDTDSQGKVSGSITIRVPSASLEATLAQIRPLGLKVLHEDANSQDVTQQYIDLDARRKNLEAYEVELTKLLETMRESTNKAADLLAVYNQLTEVRSQIEQIKGQQNYLQNTSSLATYTIVFIPHSEVAVVEPGAWDPAGTARQALHSLVQAMQGMADTGIYLALFVLPVVLLIALPFVILFLIGRWLWRRRVPRRVVAA